MKRDQMRYALHVELLERDSGLADEQSIELLRSEFALARNAGRFDALTAGDAELGGIARSRAVTGRTRYIVELFLQERASDLDDRGAIALLRRAFTDALNASYFSRLCADDGLAVTLVARTPVRELARLRRAA